MRTYNLLAILVFALHCHCGIGQNTTTSPGESSVTSATTSSPGESSVTSATTSSPAHSECLYGGTCINIVNNKCMNCSCTIGYNGEKCEQRLTRIDGSVTYNTSLATSAFTTNISSFESELKIVYPGYQDALVTLQNSSHIQICTIKYTVYIVRPANLQNYNVSEFKSRLTLQSVIDDVFSPSTGIAVYSETADIDECTSLLHTCDANSKCFNKNPVYTCVCNDGFAGDGYSCSEITCLLSDAPKLPSNAKRTIKLANGTDVTQTSYGNVLPYKSFIEYKCPERYQLSTASDGDTKVLVTECVGKITQTYQSSGWTGGSVSCNMELAYTIAVVMAAVSCVIILLVGGGFIVSCTSKKKEKEDTATLEMDTSFT